MRNIPQELLTDLSSREIWVAHIAIIRVFGQEDDPLYLTDHDRPVDFFDENDNPMTYSPFPFKVGRVEYGTETKFSQIKLTVSNITQEFSNLAMETHIEGSQITIYKVSLKKLDMPHFKIQIVDGVADKPEFNEMEMELTVLSAPELRVSKIPRRLYRRSCPWVFGKGDRDMCPYIDIGSDICNKSYPDCIRHEVQKHFGGFRKIPQISDIRGVNG